MAIFDPSRLYISLQNTGLQQKDNPLYQVIRDLIGVDDKLGRQIDKLSGGGSSGGTGATGPIGPQGPPGISGTDGVDGSDFVIPPLLPSIDLSGFVPYVGANKNVDLGLHSFTVDTPTFFVDSVNHRVGIGTLTPSAILTIESAGTTIIHIKGVDNGAGQPASGFSLFDPAAGGAVWNIENGRTPGSLDFYSGGIKLQLDAGEINAYSRIVTHVAGITQFGLNDTSVGSSWYIENGRVADALDFYNAGVKMIILGSGEVGIGTTSPNELLEVAGNIRIHVNGASQRIDIGATGDTSSSSQIRFFQDSTHYNWQIGTGVQFNDTFSITPSTAVNGTTFTTPLLTIAAGGITSFITHTVKAATGSLFQLDHSGADAGVTNDCYMRFATAGATRYYVGISVSGATGDWEIYDNTAGGLAFSVVKATAVVKIAVGLTLPGGTFATTSAALTNGAAGNLGTLGNAPAVGNPTKWFPINDNGTVRYVPAW